MEFIINFLETSTLYKKANFLPIVLIHLLLLDDDIFLKVSVRSFRQLDFEGLKPHFINIYSGLIVRARHCQLYKINLGRVARQFGKVNLSFFLRRLLFVQLLHELKILLISILNCLLELNHSGLLLQGVRSVALEL
jgi:hypothetical protein